MIHFLYLVGCAALVSVAFGAFAEGDVRAKAIYAAKLFGQFIAISLALAWLFFFIPW